MESDDTIWSCIGPHGFCSYKVTIQQPPVVFCRNSYNSTGLCSREACPLANSNYATIREKDGVMYLFMKEVERAHTPALLWDRVKLNGNTGEALRQIDNILEHWPAQMIARCKNRLMRLLEVKKRSRAILLADSGKELVPEKLKTKRREVTREAKALKASELEQMITQEIMENLKNGKYGVYEPVAETEAEELQQEIDIEDAFAVSKERTSKTPKAKVARKAVARVREESVKPKQKHKVVA